MAWADLSEVFRTLQRLLTLNISQRLEPGLAVSVTAVPPDRVGAVTNTLSMYLYHVSEDPHARNLPGRDPGSVATASMGLDLFYVLTAHHEVSGNGNAFDAERQQRLMGYALKTFHDFPIVNDATRIGGQPILVDALRGIDNRLEISLRTVTPEEALSIWTTGERQFARLAAYYEVRTVMLEPEPAERRPGRVLTLGAFVTQLGTPHLASSRSTVAFTLPAASGGGTQRLEASPAQAFLLDPPTADSRLELLGANLGIGVRRVLRLRNARWARLTGAGGLPDPADKVPLDPALNAANGWTVAFASDRIAVQVGRRVTYRRADGSLRTIDVFPGTYAADVEVVLEEKELAGRLRSFATASNETVFAISPRITGHTVDVPNGRVAVDVAPAFALDHGAGDNDELDVQLAIGGRAYRRVAAFDSSPGSDNTGRFTVAASSLTLAPHFSLTQPGAHALRLTVEGADAQPSWIEVP